MEAFIFISYSHSREDSRVVGRFAAALRRAGIDYFLDRESIPYGHDITRVVRHALNRATHVVAFLSPGTDQSQWVFFEIGIAYSFKKKIVVRLFHSKSSVPVFVSTTLRLTSSSDERRFIAKLKQLKSRASGRPTISRRVNPAIAARLVTSCLIETNLAELHASLISFVPSVIKILDLDASDLSGADIRGLAKHTARFTKGAYSIVLRPWQLFEAPDDFYFDLRFGSIDESDHLSLWERGGKWHYFGTDHNSLKTDVRELDATAVRTGMLCLVCAIAILKHQLTEPSAHLASLLETFTKADLIIDVR